MRQATHAGDALRDTRIDTLRGLFLVIMTIDHIAPDWITRYSSEPIGFVSAMEGFFLVSGYTYALVYRRYLSQPAVLWRRTLRRVGTLYAHHLLVLALVCVLAAAGIFQSGSWLERARDLSALGPGSLALWSMLLVYRPQFFDILPSYVLLMLAAPWVLQVLSGKLPGRMRTCIGLSAVLWLLAQGVDPVSWLAGRYSPVSSVWPNILAWQAIFMLGMSLVFLRVPAWMLGRTATVICGVTACLFFAMRHELMTVEPPLHVLLSKGSLGPLRMLNLLVILQLTALAVGHFARTSRIDWLALLGSHSLEVFSFHVLLAYVATSFTPASNVDSLLMVGACVAALTLPAWLHQALTRPR